MNVYVGENNVVFLNASLPSPNNLRSYLVLRDALGNPVGLIIDPTINANDVELMLGLNVETIFVEPYSPIADMVCRIAGM